MRKFSPQSPLPLQQIILGAAGLVSYRYQAFLIASVSFALLAAVSATFVDGRIDAEETRIAAAVQMSKEDVQKLISLKLEAMTGSEILVYAEELQKDGLSVVQPVTKDNLLVQYIIRTAPYVFGLMLVDLAIIFVCFTYFLSFFGIPIDTAYESAQKLPAVLLRSMGLWVVLFLRSWIWIPLFGQLIALYTLPRLSLAPVILASGEGSILQSLKLAMDRTKGRYAATLLRLVGIGLIGIACVWFSIVVAGSIGLFVLKIGFFLWLLGFMATVGFCAALMVVMAAGMR